MLFLASGPATARAQALFKLELTNKSGVALQKVEMTPIRPAGPEHTVKTDAAAGAKTVVTRPAGDLLRVVFTHGSGSFTFPVVSFFQEKDTRATLRMVKPNVPELVFFDGKDVSMALTGDNSAWGFTQVIGSLPYGVGSTTMAQAGALGAAAGAKKDEMKATQTWAGSKWSLGLRFAGETPDSVLRTLTMRLKNPDADKIDLVLGEAFSCYRYTAYRTTIDGRTLQHYELAAKGKDAAAIEEAAGELLDGKTPKSVTVLYGPAAFVDELVKAAKAGGSVRDVFARNAKIVIAAYTHTSKDDMETVTMAAAGDLAGAEK